jgi:DNA repair protein RadC
LALNDCLPRERPRERLLRLGVVPLSDVELLAVFLGTGTVGRDAIELGRHCLSTFGSLAALLNASRERFCAVDGLGPARYAQLHSLVEITRRSLAEVLTERPIFESPAAVRDYLRLSIGSRPHEVFCVLFLDAQHRLIAAEELFRGTLAQTSVYPREIVKRALEVNAAAVVFAHNHPSGIAEPSRADEALTTTLQNALALVDIRTLDHFIVATHGVYAFSEHGKL